jgi:hypothetical protein
METRELELDTLKMREQKPEIVQGRNFTFLFQVVGIRIQDTDNLGQPTKPKPSSQDDKFG